MRRTINQKQIVLQKHTANVKHPQNNYKITDHVGLSVELIIPITSLYFPEIRVVSRK